MKYLKWQVKLVLIVAFSSHVRILGECSTNPGPRLFFVCLFQVEISVHILIPFFMPGSVRSGSASWDDCGQMFPDKLQESLFPNWFPHYAWTTAVSPHRLCWVKGVCVFGLICHLHFWQNDQGLLCATAVTRGWNRPQIRNSTQCWLWRRKFSKRSCWDSNSQPFNHETAALTNKLSQLQHDRKVLGKELLQDERSLIKV